METDGAGSAFFFLDAPGGQGGYPDRGGAAATEGGLLAPRLFSTGPDIEPSTRRLAFDGFVANVATKLDGTGLVAVRL
jgi:hypothetical protein